MLRRPRLLHDVVRIVGRQAERAHGAPQQALIRFDELPPGMWVAGAGGGDQLRRCPSGESAATRAGR